MDYALKYQHDFESLYLLKKTFGIRNDTEKCFLASKKKIKRFRKFPIKNE